MSDPNQAGPPADAIPQVEIDEKSLMEEAARNTGLSDFGDEGFLVGLRKLLWSLEN
jgi:hypothetical protein